MLLLQVIVSALRRDVGGMGRAVRGVMIAMIGTFASFIICDSLLTMVDSMSTGAMQALAGTSTWTDLGSRVVNAQTLTGGALGSAAMLLCALIMLISSLVVWLALMVRKMLVIVGAAFAPIAFGGSPFDVTSSWVRRWIEFTVALIFSKLILVLLFGIGLQIELGLGQAGTGTVQQITQMMTGLLVMAIAGFAPWMAIMVVHWAGGSLQQMHYHAQAASAAGHSAVAAPQRMYAGAKGGLGGLATAGSKLASGSNGSDSANGGSGGAGSGSGSPGGAGAGSASAGGAGAGAGAGVAVGVTESAYESGKNQTAQAMGHNGGEPSGAQQNGNQQQSSSQQPGQQASGGAGSGQPAGAGGGGAAGSGGSGGGSGSSQGGGSGDGGSGSPSDRSRAPGRRATAGRRRRVRGLVGVSRRVPAGGQAVAVHPVASRPVRAAGPRSRGRRRWAVTCLWQTGSNVVYGSARSSSRWTAGRFERRCGRMTPVSCSPARRCWSSGSFRGPQCPRRSWCGLSAGAR